MSTDPLTAATERICELVNRKHNPLSWLEATFYVTEAMDMQTAETVLGMLIGQRYLARPDADLAQFLAQKLERQIRWRHAHFTGDGWREGRGG